MARIFHSIDDVPAGFGPSAVTIGNFDGIHLGHQAIAKETVAAALDFGAEPLALTFDPHPLTVVAPERTPRVLMPPAERLRRLAELGVSTGVLLNFTPELSRLTPEQFVESVLVERLHACVVVVGGNFRFGHRQAGNVDTLVNLGKRCGFDVRAIPPVYAGQEPASSSRVRTLLAEGRMAAAKRILGRPYSVTGKIVRGHGVGAKLTVPTLNLAPEAGLPPRRGVYVTRTRETASGKCWPSVSNVGVRPTFNGSEPGIETHLLGPAADFPADEMEIEFLRRLRDERRFESPEMLRRQILKDVAEAEEFYRRLEAFRERVTQLKP